MRTNVYVDGYNLYYRALRGTPYKWLDIRSLSKRLLGGSYEVNRVRYFTANVKQPGAAKRQNLYHRALEAGPKLSIHRGTFHRGIRKTRPIADSSPQEWVEILDNEEKGSDVNLASHLLLDAFENEFDAALVISNDSDLRTPIQIVRKRFGKRVLVANPSTVSPFVLPSDQGIRIRPTNLAACQFPQIVKDRHGHDIKRPKRWEKQ